MENEGLVFITNDCHHQINNTSLKLEWSSEIVKILANGTEAVC